MAASIAGKVVAITGGARGIGLATAKRMVAAGALVSIGDLDGELAVEMAKGFGGFGMQLDVRSKESFATFLSETDRRLGQLEVLINNAGIMPVGPFLEEDDALTAAQLEINLLGVIHGMKLALPAMVARKKGTIVNVASMAGRFAIPGAAVYSATKYAVVGLTESVREELRNTGVHFTTVLPSRVRSGSSAGAADGPGLPLVTVEEVAEEILRAIEGPLAEVTVPAFLKRVPGLYGLAPGFITKRLRRFVKDDQIVNGAVSPPSPSYRQRLNRVMGRP